MKPAHFTLTESGEFAPTPFAQSHWGDDHLNGPAVVGLAARTLERESGSTDFIRNWHDNRRQQSGGSNRFHQRPVPIADRVVLKAVRYPARPRE
jgi:hypothetical protein